MPKPISKLKITQHQNVWEGPSSEGKNGGISQSMLGKFLQCREEFRIKYVLGLKPNDGFSHHLEYGNMWHLCEENFAKGENWITPVKIYSDQLKARYRTQQAEIEKWYQCCVHQFPIYVDFWKKHADTKGRTGLFQEQVFKVPYALPSGRIVYLRGKFDGGDLIKDKQGSGIYLFETKTKGEVDPIALQQQLNFDMQTMMYLVALQEGYISPELESAKSKIEIKGVRYNVIRRPLSGGKGSIKQKMIDGKMETGPEYYSRLQQYFIDEPEEWFIRFKVEISQKDIDTFKQQFLNPILEQLCDWWEFISINSTDVFNQTNVGPHWRHPFGVKNMIDERGRSDYQEYINTGNTVGLQRVKTLFGELQ